MSKLYVDAINSREGNNPVLFPNGVSVAGTVTYEDVTNVDSIGIITARSGIEFGLAGAGGTVTATGHAQFVGVVTATSFVGTFNGSVNGTTLSSSTGTDLNGYKVEEGDIETTQLNGEFDYNLEDGHIQKFTGSTQGNYFPDFKVNGSTSLSSIMDVGDVVSCTLMVASTTHFLTSASIKIDNSTSNLDIDNVGGTSPNSANGSGFDIYSFTIQKTASTPAYHIVVNALSAS